MIRPTTLPALPGTAGRGVSRIEHNDLDEDGDIDIALGASYVPLGLPVSYEATLAEQMEDAPAILFLENQLVR